jgi:peptidoglycan/xylan/chitin deacetylase (PgdA/CDA1 family)
MDDGPAGGSGGAAGGGGAGGAGGASTAPDAGPVAPPALVFALGGVTTWRRAADAAYTIIHDAICDPAAAGGLATADPELTKRGLRAGFGVIASECEASEWPKLKALVAHGHDIVNHSWSHRCLGAPRECGSAMSSNDFAVEIDQATKALEDNAGAAVQYFTFPFDVCGAEAVAHLKQRGYLGARCGDRGVTEAGFSDSFATRFDVWGPNFSVYYNSGPCRGLTRANVNMAPETFPAECRTYVLTQYVEDAIKQKGWAIRAFNGFSGDRIAFQPIDPADYIAHLDYVRGRVDAGQLWTAGPATVIKYRWARERCPMPTLADATLRFPTPSAECQRFATTLSYNVSVTMADPPALKITQSGATVAARKLGPGRFVVDADPTRGDAVISQ